MKPMLIALVGFVFGMTACSERPPVDWMYAEYKSLTLICSEGSQVAEKASTASLTYTWSCPYPKDFEAWLSEFEKRHLSPRGWVPEKTKQPYTWKTYCNTQQKVVMRIVKVPAKKQEDVDRLWLSVRFPANECPTAVESSN